MKWEADDSDDEERFGVVQGTRIRAFGIGLGRGWRDLAVGRPERPTTFPAPSAGGGDHVGELRQFSRPVPVYPAYPAYHPVGTAVVADVTAGVTAGAIASAGQPSTSTTTVVDESAAGPEPGRRRDDDSPTFRLCSDCSDRRHFVLPVPDGMGAPYMQGSSVTYVVVPPA